MTSINEIKKKCKELGLSTKDSKKELPKRVEESGHEAIPSPEFQPDVNIHALISVSVALSSDVGPRTRHVAACGIVDYNGQASPLKDG